MALLKRSTKQQTLEQDAIQPITEHAEYQAIGMKIKELECLQSDKQALREALQDRRRQLRSSSFVEFLTTKFLSGESDSSEASIIEQLQSVNDEILALSKALQLATQQRDSVRGRLSSQIREAHQAVYRQHLRQGLAGMLLIQSANDAAVSLRESLERSGYSAGTFVPAAGFLSPWPYWGVVTDPSSLWQMHLRDLLDRKVIDRDEFESIADGDLVAFKP